VAEQPLLELVVVGFVEVARVVDGVAAFVVVVVLLAGLLLAGLLLAGLLLAGLGLVPPDGDAPPPEQVKTSGPGIV
jgi:hypothetical protein